MKRPWRSASFVALTLAATYVMACFVATAWAPPSDLHASLTNAGHPVRPVTGTLVPTLLAAPEPVRWVVIADSVPLRDAERAVLRDHVTTGGELWVFSMRPGQDVLWDDVADVEVFAGYLYSREGGTVQVKTPTGAQADASGLRALNLRGPWTPILESDEVSFRDTNGNGRLDAGEPAGPFVVAAARDVGAGRVVVIASGAGFSVPPEVIGQMTDGIPLGTQIALLHDAHVGTWVAPGQAASSLVALAAARDPWAIGALCVVVVAFLLLQKRRAAEIAAGPTPAWATAVDAYRQHAAAPSDGADHSIPSTGADSK